MLMAYTKIVLADELITTGLADDPFLRNDLFSYFPTQMRESYRDQIETHPLRREIVMTQVVNDLVNGAGITFFHRLSEETGATAEELVRANFVAREIFGSRAFVDEIDSYDNRIDADVQTRMRLEMRTLVERASRWLVNNRRPPMDSEATVDFFGVQAQQVRHGAARPAQRPVERRRVPRRGATRSSRRGCPRTSPVRVAVLPPAYASLTIVETAKRDDVDPLEVARVHFALGERLGLSTLVARILALPATTAGRRWRGPRCATTCTRCTRS